MADFPTKLQELIDADSETSEAIDFLINSNYDAGGKAGINDGIDMMRTYLLAWAEHLFPQQARRPSEIPAGYGRQHRQ